jgi:glycosyltransferase involved in cell wall biosynthesis
MEYQKLYPNLKYVIINNGIPIDLFPQKKYKIKSSFIYTSGSIRGLKRLLELWPEITQLLPDSILNIASYENFPNNELDNELEKVINNFDNVFHLGKLNQQKLYTLMDKTEFWLYPCSFNETSCITAMEMMMSEVICLYYPIAGLTDTMNGHGIQITEGNEIASLKNKVTDLKLAKDYAITCSWKTRAQQWDSLLNNKGEIKIINLERRKDRKDSMTDSLKLNEMFQSNMRSN